MSDELVNQLTLNYLISKTQLQKLNKNIKEKEKQKKQCDIIAYNNRIKTLFDDLLACNIPDDLLCDVKTSFDMFIDKSIYYFKAHDRHIEDTLVNSNDVIQDDIDYDKEERMIEHGNYVETQEDNEADESDEDDDNEDEDDEVYED
jgi:hypothetical protein